VALRWAFPCADPETDCWSCCGFWSVVDLGFYGSQPSRTFSEKRPCLFVRFVSFVVETFHHAGPFEAFAFFAVESTAREEIRSIGEICAKSSFHQPSFIVPALKTANCQLNTLLSIQEARTLKPRRGRQADPAAKRCRATRSPEGGVSAPAHFRVVVRRGY
jgi:hypothetical protein